MAGIAVQGRVPTDQRKPVLVVVHRTGSDDVPAPDVMALFTVGAHLPAVEIGMAIGAPGSGVGENRLGVAARTSHVFVHAPQRIGSLVVIKLRNGSNWLPTDRSVAVLAGHVQRAVWAARSSALIACLCMGKSHRPTQEQTCEQEQPGDC